MSTSVSTPSTDSKSSPATPTATNSRWARRWVTLFATLFLILLLFLVIRIQGSVSGSEFSPTHFQQRQFSFYEIPLLHLQITPIRRTGITPPTATYVRQKSLIVPYTGPPTVWHLVSISRGVTGETPADANLLVDQLNLTSAGTEYWRQWSIDHPQQAKILWPVIQKLAQRELYILMPTVFELAQLEQTPAELQQSIDDHLSTQYLALIQDMEAADRPELAQQLFSEAIKDYPQNAELNSLRLAPRSGK